MKSPQAHAAKSDNFVRQRTQRAARAA